MGQDMTNSAWSESDSALFLDYGRVFAPPRDEIARVFLDLVPAEQDEQFVFVEIGTGGGWLSEALLRHFPGARCIGLDGSDTMLESAGAVLAPFADRVELRRFRLEDSAWLAELPGDVRCFVSSLVIHHLDGAGKRALFSELGCRLAPGGALLICDIMAPASERERRYMARAWDAMVERQSRDYLGDLRAFDFFVRQRWNIYDYPDEGDRPSTIVEQLCWLEEAGFEGASVFWAAAGHAVLGGYKRSAASGEEQR